MNRKNLILITVSSISGAVASRLLDIIKYDPITTNPYLNRLFEAIYFGFSIFIIVIIVIFIAYYLNLAIEKMIETNENKRKEEKW